jgi:hypothetical protein
VLGPGFTMPLSSEGTVFSANHPGSTTGAAVLLVTDKAAAEPMDITITVPGKSFKDYMKRRWAGGHGRHPAV